MSTVPTTLGKYQIIREIARSNDIVYEGYDPIMNRRVALKELSLPTGSTAPQREERVRRFQREVKAAGSLAHPNIVTIYEVGQDDDRHFMAMEFLDGHTLRNELDTHGFLDVPRAMDIGIAVLEALEFAHSKGVIHRDIKPENIQLLEDGRVKITDFGIARLTFEPNLTIDGQVFGTPSYMSPEQVVGKEIDARSDIFSLGSVLYEMIAGQKAFAGDSVVSTTYSIMNREPVQPAQANFVVWQILTKALDKSPALRYSHASEMIDDLRLAKVQIRSGDTVLSPLPAHPMGIQAPPLNAYPYATQGPAPPPIQYPFNPYTTGGNVPGVTNSSGYPPSVNFPIYYPPPPRPPMFKAETKRFFGRVVLTFLIMGTLFALVIVAINSLTQAAERLKSSNSKAAPPVNASVEPKKPPASKSAAESATPPQDAAANAAQEANALIEEARQRMLADDYEGAQLRLSRAIERDPKNVDAHWELGSVLWELHRYADTPERATELLVNAGDSWQRGLQYDTAETLPRPQTPNFAALVLSMGAEELIRQNRIPEAAQVLFKARELAPAGSESEKRVLTLLEQIGR